MALIDAQSTPAEKEVHNFSREEPGRGTPPRREVITVKTPGGPVETDPEVMIDA
jgi:hypothetical protein